MSDERRRAWERQFHDGPEGPAAPWGYDEPDPEMRDAVRDGMLTPGGRVLDLGCGNGKNAVWLAAQGFDVVGIDFAREGLRQARERARALPWCAGDLRALPFGPRTFDAAVDIGGLHALPEADWPVYVGEVARVLRPGGVWLVRAFSDRHPAARQPWDEFRVLDLTFASATQIRDVLEGHFLIHHHRHASWGKRPPHPYEHHAHVLRAQRRFHPDRLPFAELAARVDTAEALQGLADPFQRIYLGHEFCERLAPTREVLHEVLAGVRERGIAFTLITAPTTRMAPLTERFRTVAQQLPEAEVVVNDLGVLRLLRQRFPGLRPVLGRLLTRHLRDPRLLHTAQDSANRARLGRTVLHNPAHRRWLQSQGVVRAELDNPPFLLDTSPTPVPLSLHYPYVYLTFGRACAARCDPAMCRTPLVLRHPSMELPLLQHGGAVLYRNSWMTNFGAAGVDRLVWQAPPT